MVIVDTERLLLRCFRVSDVAAMNRVFTDAEVMRFGEIRTARWVDDWLRSCIAAYDHDSGVGSWAVVDKSSDNTMGYCGLFSLNDLCGQAETEIGYRLARHYWGYGFATEAARAVCDYAFSTLGLTRLVAMIDPDNVASTGVAKKLGMQYEKDVMLEGYTHPDHLYVLTQGVNQSSTDS
jgi:RimJ/RimL family protein N-acetyltransferase